MEREFDEKRAMRAFDRLFKEVEEMKIRISFLEKLVNVMNEEKRNDNGRDDLQGN